MALSRKHQEAAYRSEQHLEDMEHSASDCGYENCYEQALDYIHQQLPGTINPERLARRVVNIAAEKLDSISRVIGMRMFE